MVDGVGGGGGRPHHVSSSLRLSSYFPLSSSLHLFSPPLLDDNKQILRNSRRICGRARRTFHSRQKANCGWHRATGPQMAPAWLPPGTLWFSCIGVEAQVLPHLPEELRQSNALHRPGNYLPRRCVRGKMSHKVLCIFLAHFPFDVMPLSSSLSSLVSVWCVCF